ncbi:hypothetical protein DGG96_03565 [Legionella qingyii]|uniref:Uncharacterized protein n=1 Tax=Legionella qingyii TaxID=2184757 RepID=A0A317U841_9GAMM|nr:hypothetical protein [Legionella qingyii]PWY57076.1 hypothetical protein DGG96_03565 [Legionella qingyii]
MAVISGGHKVREDYRLFVDTRVLAHEVVATHDSFTITAISKRSTLYMEVDITKLVLLLTTATQKDWSKIIKLHPNVKLRLHDYAKQIILIRRTHYILQDEVYLVVVQEDVRDLSARLDELPVF